MGVSGSGKSTVGAALAQRLRVPFGDADDFHPQANIDKMSAGIALDDADREPWLDAIAQWLEDRATTTGGVVTCSALKRAYRDRIAAATPVVFVHLAGSREVIARRQASRPGHFMPASLLDSQFRTLEPLEADETGIVLDVGQPVDDLVAEAAEQIAALPVGAAGPTPTSSRPDGADSSESQR
ncbi:gluconokinase [Nocardioides zeae]|uniref:Gluconokinase n=1 Tax=Nocardioides imazamoxiresistens TaxID=3231893 RepID=A0ABU3PXL1_9ACTN|nr:gluconokinase [Nocardioides zeae]MDT9593975.1 gluconokinase [Nocardioides zeae]